MGKTAKAVYTHITLRNTVKTVQYGYNTKMENDIVLSLAFFNLSIVVNVFFAIYIPIINAAIEESSNKTSCFKIRHVRIKFAHRLSKVVMQVVQHLYILEYIRQSQLPKEKVFVKSM